MDRVMKGVKRLKEKAEATINVCAFLLTTNDNIVLVGVQGLRAQRTNLISGCGMAWTVWHFGIVPGHSRRRPLAVDGFRALRGSFTTRLPHNVQA
jgi:hypothetical protein